EPGAPEAPADDDGAGSAGLLLFGEESAAGFKVCAEGAEVVAGDELELGTLGPRSAAEGRGAPGPGAGGGKERGVAAPVEVGGGGLGVGRRGAETRRKQLRNEEAGAQMRGSVAGFGWGICPNPAEFRL